MNRFEVRGVTNRFEVRGVRCQVSTLNLELWTLNFELVNPLAEQGSRCLDKQAKVGLT